MMGEDGVGAKKGVFSHLFDWNKKSRKKLFANGSTSLLEGKKKAKTDDNLYAGKFCVLENDAEITRGILGARKSCEYSCTSSVIDEEGFGAKAPGLVARLMGLDSLPATGMPGPLTSPPVAPRPLKVRQRQESVPKFDVGDYFIDMSCGSDHYLRMPPECQKVPSSPVERFGMEILPPRSKSPTPVTRCRMLSPIRNPRFISPENAADIMEAAAKMYELGLRGNSAMMARMAGSSSFPLRVHERRDDAVDSHSPSRQPESPWKNPESNDSENFRGQHSNKTWSVFKSNSDSSGENNAYDRGRKEGKLISVTPESKINQRRPVSNVRKGHPVKKEENKNEPFKIQSSAQRNKMQMRVSAPSNSGALKVNNQKQNCMTNKGKSINQPSSSKQQVTKISNEGAHRTQNRRQNSIHISPKHQATKDTASLGKEPLSTKAMNNTRKKRLTDVDVKKNATFAYSSAGRHDKRVQSNIVTDEHLNVNQDKDRWHRKANSDVVSFTFTSSIARPMPSHHLSHGVTGKQAKDGSVIDAFGEKSSTHANYENYPILGVNVIDDDSRSSSVEHNLGDLCPSVAPSDSSGMRNTLEVTSTSGSWSHALIPCPTKMATDMNDISCWGGKGILGSHSDVASHSKCYHLQGPISEQQTSKSLTNDCIIKEAEESDQQLPSPFSVLEACFSGESCESSESSISFIGQDQDGNDFALLKELQSVGNEREVPEMTTSATNGTLSGAPETDIDYVREILSTVMLQSGGSVLSDSEVILDPLIYEQLECKSLSRSCEGIESNLKRKLLFDCVGECLSLRHHCLLGAGFRSRVNGIGGIQENQVVEDVYKEIVLWRSMESWKVDEIVDRDFCRHLGRGVDIKFETFETGVDIQEAILTTLIDETIAELLIPETKYVPFLQSPLLVSKPTGVVNLLVPPV